MKLKIEITEEDYKWVCDHVNMGYDLFKMIANGTPIPDNATNGQVLLQMFPPSVYFGDDEKHIVLLTKDCELTCYNNEWWNAPYERSADENDN